MHIAINFNDKTSLSTTEINNESTQRMLAAKLETVQLICSE